MSNKRKKKRGQKKKLRIWKAIKFIIKDIFTEGMIGMGYGLFATLIIGVILEQLAVIIGGMPGIFMNYIGTTTMYLTGAGIGVGVALHYKEQSLVTISASICGMMGAYAGSMLNGTFMENDVVNLVSFGEPLSAFIAAYVGIKCGHLVAGKTQLDILITPVVTIFSGTVVGFLIGPPISRTMIDLGAVINAATEESPLMMGIIVSVAMGVMTTLPLSAAAWGVILNLSGLAAGAATVGCCCNMIGFAVASFHENRFSGLFTQGIGTSMLQWKNVSKKPIIWLPALLSSVILGPVSTVVLGMTNNATGSGMGTAGFIGQIMTYQTMVGEGFHGIMVIIEIIVMHFIAPGVIAYAVSEYMRHKHIIVEGDMKLKLEN
ncbi:MAG: PTS sugar transporter subunit IIC [Lachnospiraceae bacterium]|nr:PTS sugar transporter subunit IIC [Lachnospiraceae bacterium]